MVWINTIEPDDATGRVAEAYQWQARKLGRPTEFTQLGSLDAEVVHARLMLYRASENVPSRLTASQRALPVRSHFRHRPTRGRIGHCSFTTLSSSNVQPSPMHHHSLARVLLT